MTDTPEELRQRIAGIHTRIRAACEQAGRDPAAVTLIAVSKTFPAGLVRAAFDAGLREFGENRVQEGAAKAESLAAEGIRPRWHLIGHLQTNKTAAAVGHFDTIHSVDSARLLDAIAARSGPARPIGIFLQVNVAGEATKSGVTPAGLPALVEHARGTPGVILHGLMTIAPHTGAEAARPVFRELRRLAEQHGLEQLSMGMSEDFEAAIAEGATHIRVGRAIFGGRQ